MTGYVKGCRTPAARGKAPLPPRHGRRPTTLNNSGPSSADVGFGPDFFCLTPRSRRAGQGYGTSVCDPGCVKSLAAVVHAQQQNKMYEVGESFVREKCAVRINLAPR
jgi:hypothetical protein